MYIVERSRSESQTAAILAGSARGLRPWVWIGPQAMATIVDAVNLCVAQRVCRCLSTDQGNKKAPDQTGASFGAYRAYFFFPSLSNCEM
jgi:hypothetical protein